jgi:hypothetical protein
MVTTTSTGCFLSLVQPKAKAGTDMQGTAQAFRRTSGLLAQRHLAGSAQHL